jgi:multidrug efflux pump subunit AcrA (membrane-fusion protein)
MTAAGCVDSKTNAVETQRIEPRKMQVELTVAEVKPLAVSSEFTGNLLPRRRTIVVSEVDGIVRDIPAVGPNIDVEVNGTRYVEQLGIGYGHEVKKGDLLVQLDSADFELELLIARAKLAKANADLAKLRAWERPEAIERLAAVRDEAQARHEQALAELDRAVGLGTAISTSDLDARRTDVTTTKAMLGSHEAMLRTATAGPTKEELAVQEALLAQAEAEVKQKEQDLTKATIHAPYDGVVTDMYVEVGERVSAASGQILELMDLRFLVAEVGVPEAYMSQLKIRDLATVHAAGSHEPVPGLIVSINDKLDPESRSFRVRVAIDNIERRFKAGQFVRVAMNIGSHEQDIVIPSRAITFAEGQPGVYVYNDGVVTRTSITLGVGNDEHVTVLSGINAGDSVVTDNPALLTDGMKVEVRTANPS